LLVDKAEDQFALPAGIRCTDDTVHVWAVHQLLQDTKLLFGAGRHQILPLLRHDGQVCDAPLDVLGIINIGRCQFHQMTDTPTDEIAVALKVAILTIGGTEDFGVGHRHRGFLADHKLIRQ